MRLPRRKKKWCNRRGCHPHPFPRYMNKVQWREYYRSHLKWAQEEADRLKTMKLDQKSKK